jgi:hypothetical protein
MHRITAIALLASPWLLLGPSARADLQLSITQDPSSTVDLNAWNPGQTATFDVSLSGIQQGQTIDFLGATLHFDSNILGTPTLPIAGDIVPSSGVFLPAVGPGLSDASYLSVDSTTLITHDGVFFRFSLTPIASGSGTISFSDGINPPDVFVDYTNADSSTGNNISAGPDLSFQVPGVSAVPEPSSSLVVLFVGAVVGLRQGRLWLRARRTIPRS